jgi:hypothetical protein
MGRIWLVVRPLALMACTGSATGARDELVLEVQQSQVAEESAVVEGAQGGAMVMGVHGGPRLRLHAARILPPGEGWRSDAVGELVSAGGTFAGGDHRARVSRGRSRPAASSRRPLSPGPSSRGPGDGVLKFRGPRAWPKQADRRFLSMQASMRRPAGRTAPPRGRGAPGNRGAGGTSGATSTCVSRSASPERARPPVPPGRSGGRS